MASEANQPIRIEVLIQPDQPGFLEGLDFWLRSGLLSSAQVLEIGQSLTCAVPTLAEAAAASDDFLPPTPVPQSPSRRPRRVRATPSRDRSEESAARGRLVPQALTALMAEISVVWLLFLGVFLVVVSSAVLAASQWQNFSAIGQYAILLGYTLLFWLAGAWSQKQPNLQVTSRMLQVTTLLVIPVNFWMMDGFRLWQGGLGMGTVAIASLVLSAIAVHLFRGKPRWLLANHLGLSWLHWGWAAAGIPLIATYVGTIGTALLLFRQREDRQEERWGVALVPLIFGSLLLVGRAVLGAGVPLHQLALALGVCGWVLCWLTRLRPQPGWTQAGIGLLISGWFIGLTGDPPWQAIGVSALVVWLLGDRLQRRWQRDDLTGLLLVAIQAYTLLWWLVPSPARQQLLNTALRLAGAPVEGGLIGLGVFPCVCMAAGLAAWLRRQQQPALAKHAEVLALALGIILTSLSLGNPLLRSLVLTLAVLTLTISLGTRHAPEAVRICLTHVAALLGLLSWVRVGFPELDSYGWAIVLLVATAVEWSLYALVRQPIWQRSAWFLGLALAAIAYPLVLGAALPPHIYRGLVWLIVPAILTALSYRPQLPHPRLSGWLSVGGLVLAQGLSLSGIQPFLVSAGLALGVMLLNTHRLQHRLAAVVTVGFGVAFAIAAADQYGREIASLSIWIAALLWLLWLLRSVTARHASPGVALYTPALNGWAIGLAVLLLTYLTLRGVDAFASTPAVAQSLQPVLLPSAVIATGAIAFRLWQQPTDLGFYGVSWGVGLTTASAIALTSRSLTHLAIANGALGWIAYILGDLWRPGDEARRDRSSRSVVPVLFALLGTLLAHRQFTATTGIYTLALALIIIGVGRRRANGQPLTLLGVLGISVAAYELLIYRLIQAQGGEAGDGITLMAGLAAAIALVFWLLERWLLPFLRLESGQIWSIAGLHWFFGTGLSLLARSSSLSPTGRWLWVGVGLALAAYAIGQGRRHAPWIYAGAIQLTLALFFLIQQSAPQIVPAWIGAIAAAYALGLYWIPWRSGGWATRPWKQVAAALPGIATLLTAWTITIPSLLLVGGFYAGLAYWENQPRLSYGSVLLADWAFLRFFLERNVTEPLWYMAIPTLSLLYVAQIDPTLRSDNQKETRHWLRVAAVGLFCLTALYQSESSLGQGFLVILLGIGLVIAGLVLRVRAYLYVGTVVFIIKVLRQLWLFISDYSLLLWALGILLGLALIWIAATFESRRSQAIAIVQYWVSELEAWD